MDNRRSDVTEVLVGHNVASCGTTQHRSVVSVQDARGTWHVRRSAWLGALAPLKWCSRSSSPAGSERNLRYITRCDDGGVDAPQIYALVLKP